MKHASVAAAVLLGALVVSASAQQPCENSTIDLKVERDARVAKFYERFRSAVKQDDRKAVASMMKYPVRDNRRKHIGYIRSEQQLLANYERIFDAPLKEAIVSTDSNCISEAGWRGYMLGLGLLWFFEEGDGFLIKAINEPVSSKSMAHPK